jgi:hypothetical protein
MNAGLQAQVKTPARPSFTPLRTGLLQRKCACGGTPGRSGECEECREKRLNVQRRAAHEAESAIVDRALHALPTSTPSLAYNFATVPVYTPSPIRIQTKLGVNQPGDTYEQEADRVSEYVLRAEARAASDRNEPPRLSSAQTRVQRQEADEAPSGPTETTEPPAPAPETVPEPASPAETPTAGLLVEDEATELGPGQMNKSEFLDGLRAAVCAAADAELAAVGRSTEGCPYIEYWIGYYGTRSGDYIERAIRKYAPETAGVTTAGDYIPLITERIRHGVMTWATTGQITGVPEELASLAPGAGGLLAGAASAASDVVSGMGGLLFKARDGGAREADPQEIRSQLRSGSPLDGGVKSRMESAFGHDFSRVRVHTDGQAANLSSTVNARAFTVGEQVAFGAGEYQPGTLIGDALIAHELAHVVQQGGAATSTDAPLQKGDGAYTALEEDADQSAVGAVVSAWSGAKSGLAKIAQSAMPRLKSGLRLSRCKSTPSPAPPAKTVALNIAHLEQGPASHAADLTKAEETYRQANIKFDVSTPPPFDDAKTKSLIGNDYILDEFTSVGSPTAEETALTADPAGRKAGAISMYYVKGMSHGSTGESFPASLFPTFPASVIISSTDTKETFSHELGHMLLNDGGHHPSRDNLMFQPNFQFNLDDTQKKTIYNSPFAK